MAWLFLFAAGACEMLWPLGFKYTHGFRDHWLVVGLTFLIMLASFGLMSLATTRGIPVGTAYAVWTALGATGTVVLGMALFGESRDVVRLLCLGLIVAGVVGLKLRERPAALAPAQPPAATTIPTR